MPDSCTRAEVLPLNDALTWPCGALQNNELQMIVRAHECVMDGFERFAQGHLITLFSATNYCGTANNAGAILVRSPVSLAVTSHLESTAAASWQRIRVAQGTEQGAESAFLLPNSQSAWLKSGKLSKATGHLWQDLTGVPHYFWHQTGRSQLAN